MEQVAVGAFASDTSEEAHAYIQAASKQKFLTVLTTDDKAAKAAQTAKSSARVFTKACM